MKIEIIKIIKRSKEKIKVYKMSFTLTKSEVDRKTYFCISISLVENRYLDVVIHDFIKIMISVEVGNMIVYIRKEGEHHCGLDIFIEAKNWKRGSDLREFVGLGDHTLYLLYCKYCNIRCSKQFYDIGKYFFIRTPSSYEKIVDIEECVKYIFPEDV